MSHLSLSLSLYIYIYIMACTVKLKIFFIFSQKKKSTEDFIERENALAFLHQQKLYITCTT